MDARPRPIRPRIQIEPDYARLCDVAARLVLASAQQAIATRGRFSVALSGGTTPRGLYERLAAAPLANVADWPAWHIFWGDERWVSPRDSRSNYHLACTALLDHVRVNPAQVHPMVPADRQTAAPDYPPRTELEAVDFAAGVYEGALVSELSVAASSDAGPTGVSRRPPRIDLVLLGLGDDGHTASLFPGARALEEIHKWVVAAPAPGGAGELALPRMTMTLPVLNAAREVIFLVSGAAKSSVVAAVLEADDGTEAEQRPPLLPAARVVPSHGRLTWLLDQDAAG